MSIISPIIIVILGVGFGFLISMYEKKKFIYEEDRKYDKISFGEALDLTDLPVITFRQDDVKINFLLDTGASHSQIDGRLVNPENFNFEVTDGLTNVSGMDNNKHECGMIKMSLYLKDKPFEATFCVNNVIGSAFDDIKSSDGVSIHGILGVDFFNKYKYVIDFDRYVAYSKA